MINDECYMKWIFWPGLHIYDYNKMSIYSRHYTIHNKDKKSVKKFNEWKKVVAIA